MATPSSSNPGYYEVAVPKQVPGTVDPATGFISGGGTVTIIQTYADDGTLAYSQTVNPDGSRSDPTYSPEYSKPGQDIPSPNGPLYRRDDGSVIDPNNINISHVTPGDTLKVIKDDPGAALKDFKENVLDRADLGAHGVDTAAGLISGKGLSGTGILKSTDNKINGTISNWANAAAGKNPDGSNKDGSAGEGDGFGGNSSTAPGATRAGGGGSATGSSTAALAAAAALRDKFSSAYDSAAPGVAPTITATMAKDPTLASYLAQLPTTSATAAQVGAIPQVVAPQIGAAPTVQAGTATAGQATPASSINVALAKAAQAQSSQAKASQATATLLDPTQQAEWRDQQKTLAGYLNDAIQGKAPSVAELQLREAEQRQEANQLGLAAKASGGGNVALALRTAANNIGRLNQGASADSALLRAQEIAAARGQLGDVAGTARNSDISLAGQNANLATGVSQSNAGLLTGVSQSNAGLATDVSKANAGLTTDVSKLNASNQTDASKTLAQLLTQANIANAGNATQASVANAGNQTQASAATAQNMTTLLAKKADLEYQASHDNAGNALNAQETQAKLATDVSLANALAQNTADLQTQRLSEEASATNATNSTNTNINNAKFINDAASSNATNTLTQKQLDEKTKQDAAGNALDASRTVVNGNTGLQDLALRQQQADWSKTKDIAGAVGTGAATLFSDRRAKTDISDGEAAAQSILDAMNPKTFRYKDGGMSPGEKPGRQTGVMAQDLERSPAGRPLVKDTPRGKMIDGAGSTGTLMAMLATLNKRLDRVEGRHA